MRGSLGVVAVVLTGCTVGHTKEVDQVTAHQALVHGTVVSDRDESGYYWFDIAPVGQSFPPPVAAQRRLHQGH